uniref:Uncharacterized protein n=1 Tax=Cyanoderma ruficeps TaxID=181631 RepID=A0A8C3QS35_9PASS
PNLCVPIGDLQKGSNQIFSRSLHERDLEIGRLRRESEKLKRDQALAAGIVSLQKIQQLQQETEKLNKENQEKDKQLAVVSAKVGTLSSSFFTHFYQVIEKVRQISDENHQSHEREKSLQKELSSRLSLKVTDTGDWLVPAWFHLFQACLRSPCSSTSLQGELGQLEVLCLDPSVSAIRTAVVDMARGPLAWLEGAEQLLDSAGMDLRTSGKGLCPHGHPWECGMSWQARCGGESPP